jgi:hypothetical protein
MFGYQDKPEKLWCEMSAAEKKEVVVKIRDHYESQLESCVEQIGEQMSTAKACMVLGDELSGIVHVLKLIQQGNIPSHLRDDAHEVSTKAIYQSLGLTKVLITLCQADIDAQMGIKST